MLLLETVGQGNRQLTDRHRMSQADERRIPLPTPSTETEHRSHRAMLGKRGRSVHPSAILFTY